MYKLARAAILTATWLALAGAATAQSYPSKPIRMIVPAAAGGSTDIGARNLARLLSAELGQPVVVENKGGGGGRIGATEVARAQPDGYTLLYGNSITHALLPALAKSLAYDPFKDFVPVAQMFWYSTLIVCNPAMPFNDLAGLIKYAKQNPKQMTTATAGVGSGNHFSSALLGSMAGIELLNVPYKGNAPAVQDVIGGVASCTHISEAKPYLDAGRLKAIATTGMLRDPRFPTVPTVDEAGLKGYDATWWQALLAPAGTPAEIVARLSAAAKAAAQDPRLKAATFESGLVPQYAAPAELILRMQQDIAKFRRIAAEAHLELE